MRVPEEAETRGKRIDVHPRGKRSFDVFFGLEAASDEGLAGIVKDTGVWASIEAARISRSFGYGVTGNFLVDET